MAARKQQAAPLRPLRPHPPAEVEEVACIQGSTKAAAEHAAATHLLHRAQIGGKHLQKHASSRSRSHHVHHTTCSTSITPHASQSHHMHHVRVCLDPPWIVLLPRPQPFPSIPPSSAPSLPPRTHTCGGADLVRGEELVAVAAQARLDGGHVHELRAGGGERRVINRCRGGLGDNGVDTGMPPLPCTLRPPLFIPIAFPSDLLAFSPLPSPHCFAQVHINGFTPAP